MNKICFVEESQSPSSWPLSLRCGPVSVSSITSVASSLTSVLSSLLYSPSTNGPIHLSLYVLTSSPSTYMSRRIACHQKKHAWLKDGLGQNPTWVNQMSLSIVIFPSTLVISSARKYLKCSHEPCAHTSVASIVETLVICCILIMNILMCEKVSLSGILE